LRSLRAFALIRFAASRRFQRAVGELGVGQNRYIRRMRPKFAAILILIFSFVILYTGSCYVCATSHYRAYGFPIIYKVLYTPPSEGSLITSTELGPGILFYILVSLFLGFIAGRIWTTKKK
jgi:hypothetical protein